jgi:hypothetical protein
MLPPQKCGSRAAWPKLGEDLRNRSFKADSLIESIMFFGVGFCAAGLSVLVVVPLVHGRAIRLTTRRLEGAIPSSRAEVLADKDLQRAEFALSTRRLEVKLEYLTRQSANQLSELGRKCDALNCLTMEHGTLRDQLRTSEEKCAAKISEVHQAQDALAEKETERASLASALSARSALADLQKVEIAALRMQFQALQKQLAVAEDKIRLAEQRRHAERVSLKMATEERVTFENSRDRVSELVRQLLARSREDEILSRRTQDDLQRRVVEQSRLLDESERELKRLRIEIAERKAEYDLRLAMLELDQRANAAA